MNTKLLTTVTKQIGASGMLVLLVSLAIPVSAQICVSNLNPAVAAASSGPEPKKV